MFITYMEKAYDSEPERMRQWEKMAKSLGVKIVEDPALAKERHDRQMAIVMAELGGGDDVAG